MPITAHRAAVARQAELATFSAVMDELPRELAHVAMSVGLETLWTHMRAGLDQAERRNLPRIERACRAGLRQAHAAKWTTLERELRVYSWVEGALERRRERLAERRTSS